MNNYGRSLAIWVVIGISLIALFNLFQGSSRHGSIEPVAYSEFLENVNKGRVADVTIRGQQLLGRTVNGRTFSTVAPQDPMLVQRLIDKNVHVTASSPEDETPPFFQILLTWFPGLLFIAIWVFFWRQMQSGGNRALSFGKSRAKMMGEKNVKVTFNDVAGVDEAKQELEEIVDFLKDPQKFQRLGGSIPKGVLLVGPPGTGKTLLARAIAGEANVPFFNISGSEFVEMFVGVGASRVRDMFEQGKKNAPCLIFIDEIDAVGRHRGFGLGGGNDEREQTLNQLLVEMDGFETNEGVIIIAATNRPDVLDPALLRPGRFDRQVVVPNPDIKGREQILKVHMKKVPLAPNVQPDIIARGTPGFSGADLSNLVNEAALLAARKGRRQVSQQEFEEAKDKVLMGAERRSLVMSEDEKRLTAYHEAGHALVGLHMPASDPIHKATIIPRGRALGMVVKLPENDRISVSREKLYSDICTAAAGRIAEELIFGYDKTTAGAASDIKAATSVARRMVMEWGMSDKLGFLSYAEEAQEVFLGHSLNQSRNISEATAQVIDQEVRKIIDQAYNHAKKILETNKDKLHLLANSLLEHETLTGEEIHLLLEGKEIIREEPVVVKPESRRRKIPSSKAPEKTPQAEA